MFSNYKSIKYKKQLLKIKKEQKRFGREIKNKKNEKK